MIGITLLVCWPPCWLSLYAAPTRQSVELVRKLGSVDASARQRIQRELMDRPDALWPVLWGTRHQNSDIAIACREIMEEWSWRSRLAEMVGSVDGDFDRFVNSLLYSPARGLELFAAASQKAQALDRYYVRKSFLSDPKGFPRLARAEDKWLTPFHEFSAYLRAMQPVAFEERFLRVPSARARPWLARCDGVEMDGLGRSIVLSEGNVKVALTSASLVVCGADVTIEKLVSSVIIASGDVRLKGWTGTHGAAHAVVIAGGRVSVEDGATMAKVFLISPSQISITGARVEPAIAPLLILDGKPRPAPELFTFRSLWVDYGVEATLEQARVKVTRLRPDAPMASFFRENDIILAAGETKIESVGQFRRLLGHARDTGRLRFQVERNGEQVSLQADLKKGIAKQH